MAFTHALGGEGIDGVGAEGLPRELTGLSRIGSDRLPIIHLIGIERRGHLAQPLLRFEREFRGDAEVLHVGERHHATEGEGQYEKPKEGTGQVVPFVPKLLVGSEPFASPTGQPQVTDGQIASGQAHQAAHAGEPDYHLAPQFRVLTQRSEVDPVRNSTYPSPKTALLVCALQHFPTFRREVELVLLLVVEIVFIDRELLLQASERNPLLQLVEGIYTGDGCRYPMGGNAVEIRCDRPCLATVGRQVITSLFPLDMETGHPHVTV